MPRVVSCKVMWAGRAKALVLALVIMASALAASLLALAVATRSAEAAFDGDNGEIVFRSERLSTGPGLYTITAAGGTATKIPGTSGGDNQAAWSPDGSRIVFQSTNATSETNKEISVMNADGSGRRQLTTTPVAEEEPTWSPDGSQMAFAKAGPGSGNTDLEIWVMNADGSGLTQLTTTGDGVKDTQPAWSPLGDRIAFHSVGRGDDTNSNIYVMDTDPTTDDNAAINLTQNDFSVNPVYQWNDEDPSWSPDGTQITYDTVQDVWKMASDDGDPKTNLTKSTGGGQNPAWSPDGNSIVYVRRDGTDQNIYVMGANGGSPQAVDTTPRKDDKPDWQPDPPTCDVSDPTDPNGNNTLIGRPAKDEVICGFGGNDTITGQDGDILIGGDGNDALIVSSGRATLNGGPGKDTASFADSRKTIDASLISGFAQRLGTDPLEGVALVDVEDLTGTDRNDVIEGSNGPNKLVGGDGNDKLFGLGGNDRLDSRDGVTDNDRVDGGADTDTCATDGDEAVVKNCER